MSKEKNNLLGEYFSNSFIIKCHCKINFENLNLSDTYEQLGTFFHEYIHFLQNSSTTYGNSNLALYYAKTLDKLNYISNLSENIMPKKIPFSDEIDFYDSYFDLTLGDYEDWTYDTVSTIEILSSQVYVDPLFEKKLETATPPTINLKMSSGNCSEEKPFHFGARAISESMASLFEKKMYNVKNSKMQVQYDICTLLWNYYSPNKYKDRTDLIFAMCEGSLMFKNPGIIFYLILVNFIPTETDEITVDTIFKYFSIQKNFESSYLDSYKKMIDFFDKIFPNDKKFKNVKDYVASFSKNLFQKRQSNLHFLTDIYLLPEKDMKKKLFEIIISTKALPLIVDNENEIWSLIDTQKEEMNMLYHYLIYTFNELSSFSSNGKCSLYEICLKNCISQIDSRCKNSPWLKSEDDKLCPFAMFWYMWN